MRRLDRAEAGEAGFGVITGEPGIGKSRLCAELAARARARGATVLVGRCSQDDGAPPLWPWELALRTLGVSVPGSPVAVPGAPTDGPPGARPQDGARGGEFAGWSQTARTVLEAARDDLVLVVLDDLHWSDTASLRVLRLLVEQATTERLLLVATWRDRPAPTGALADAAEVLARAHAEQVELTGLDASSVAGILDAVGHRHPDRPRDRRAATAYRREPVLPRGVRPPGRHPARPGRAARRGGAPPGRPGGAGPAHRPAARRDPTRAERRRP